MQHPYHDRDDDDDASTLESKSLAAAGGADDLLDDGAGDGGGPGGGTGGGGGYGAGAGGGGGRALLPRVVTAGDELESLTRAETSGGGGGGGGGGAASIAGCSGFPPTCLPILRLLGGNHCCVDCGDEDRKNIRYGSAGYGTVLCGDCATRHVTMSEEVSFRRAEDLLVLPGARPNRDQESNIKSLKDDPWTLRSTLHMFEGGNSKMLEYVKHKPRWRPPKGTPKESMPEDVLAFKQIYLSKAAAAYRKDLAKRADEARRGRIKAMREEDAAAEEREEARSAALTTSDPFRKIVERADVSADDIPELFGEKESRNSDAGLPSGGGGGGARGRGAAGSRKGRSATTPMGDLMTRGAPSVDQIKERIAARRSRNSSIAAQQAALDESDPGSAGASLPSRRPTLDRNLVGEVGDASIRDHPDRPRDDRASADRASYRGAALPQGNRQWSEANPYAQLDEASYMSGADRTMVSYSSRANAPQLGMYRRLDAGAAEGEGRMVPHRRASYTNRLVERGRRLEAGANEEGRMVPRRASNKGRLVERGQ
ncbi:hypothetical protein ACHAWF_012479 [Thalassiosira exigua]